jgi:hypothetical protein
MLSVSVDDEHAIPAENDVVVDHDLGLCRDGGRALAVKGVRTTASGDGVSNSVLRARQYRPAQLTSTGLARPAGAECPIGDGRAAALVLDTGALFTIVERVETMRIVVALNALAFSITEASFIARSITRRVEEHTDPGIVRIADIFRARVVIVAGDLDAYVDASRIGSLLGQQVPTQQNAGR